MTEITLLDGGMGQELVARVSDAPTGQWSSRIMRDHPGLVAEVHGDFFDAGATVATTNTYALHLDRFKGSDMDGLQPELMAQALDEAKKARTAHGRGRLAGSIGPLGWSYDPKAHTDLASARALYGELAAQLAPHVDLLIGETIASVGHARALLEAARETGLPVWLAVTVDDEDGSLLRSREPLSDLADLDADAWLANCSTPEATGAAMEVFAGFGKPFGAYANGFVEINKDFLNATSVVDILAGRDIDPESYADFAMGWVSQGATIVGGCCEIGPDHIRELARRLRAEGHTIV